jgi:hypothetical protein
MDTQEFWDRLLIPPTHTALSRDPEICHDLLRRRDPPPGPLHAIGEMHQTQVQLRLRMHRKESYSQESWASNFFAT